MEANKNPPPASTGQRVKKLSTPRIVRFREAICRLLCGARLFNSDMSAEIDRLQIENDRLRERLPQ